MRAAPSAPGETLALGLGGEPPEHVITSLAIVTSALLKVFIPGHEARFLDGLAVEALDRATRWEVPGDREPE